MKYSGQYLIDLSILDNATLASVVYTFDAADAETGDNAVVTYSIVSGNA